MSAENKGNRGDADWMTGDRTQDLINVTVFCVEGIERPGAPITQDIIDSMYDMVDAVERDAITDGKPASEVEGIMDDLRMRLGRLKPTSTNDKTVRLEAQIRQLRQRMRRLEELLGLNDTD